MNTIALEAPRVEAEEGDGATSLTEQERAMLETIGLFGDEGWEAVAANFPVSWRTLHSVPAPRTAYHGLVQRDLVLSNDGKISMTEKGKWLLQLTK